MYDDQLRPFEAVLNEISAELKMIRGVLVAMAAQKANGVMFDDGSTSTTLVEALLAQGIEVPGIEKV